MRRLSWRSVPRICSPPSRDDLLLVLFAVGLDLFEDLQLACIRQVLFPIEDLFEQEVGIAAEENVGAAARHVRGDGDGALAAGLGDDFGFFLMLLGVEHVVFDAVPAQDSRRAAPIFRWKSCRPGPAGRARGIP